MQNEVTIEQKYLGKKGLVIFLAALTAFGARPISICRPCPMTDYFNVPEYQTNLTLILFFVVYAVPCWWGLRPLRAQSRAAGGLSCCRWRGSSARSRATSSS